WSRAMRRRAEKAEAERDAARKDAAEAHATVIIHQEDIDELHVLAHDLREALDAAISARDAARAFGEEAARKYNAMLIDVTCAFCGTSYPANTPRTGHSTLEAHVRVCEAHPMRAVEAERDVLRQALIAI